MTGKQSHSRLHDRVRPAWCWRRLLAGASVLLLLAACDRPSGMQMTAEVDEPHFRRGRQALQSNQKQIALEAFQKVIDKRLGDAPESHLEVGRIYLEHLKDYVPAIYHFRRYLELTGPNGTYAPQVKQMIETAQKEFARKLAGNPLEAQIDRLDYEDQIAKLRAENNALRSELERYTRGGRPPAAVATTPPAGAAAGRQSPPVATAAPPVTAPAPQSSAWTNAIADSSPAPDVVPLNPPVQNPPATRTAPTAPSADAGRTYTVEKGDTLVAISRKVYGSASHWRAIYDANRDRIPDPNALKIGTELRLP